VSDEISALRALSRKGKVPPNRSRDSAVRHEVDTPSMSEIFKVA